MKKLLLVFSLIISLLFNNTSIVTTSAEEQQEENYFCEEPSNSIVRVLNNYELLKSNGFVFKTDNWYAYILTSSTIIKQTNTYKIMYSNGITKKADVVGYDTNNEVAILRTLKVSNVNPVCFANSNYIYKGQKNYAYGYYDLDKEFYQPTTLNQIGDLYKKNGYINIYKSTIQIQGSQILLGTGIFDELNRLIGMITNFDSRLIGSSYITDSNKLLKIANSIVESGKYNINYIKYNLEDYNGLSSIAKKNYGVSSKATKGVVITTFKPFNYIFGGLNQGMVIVSVNGIEVKNGYELDSQLERYKKKNTVCLEVMKKSGKIAFYYVEI